jgi:hypothetical protein
MPYCPNCGTEVGGAKFCPNCGTEQGKSEFGRPSGSPEFRRSSSDPQPVYVSTRHQYDSTICLLLCCCVTPIGAIIYYMLSEHPDQQYDSRY